MIDPMVTQIGTGGILALLIVREVAGIIKLNKKEDTLRETQCVLHQGVKEALDKKVDAPYCLQRKEMMDLLTQERIKAFETAIARLEAKIDSLPQKLNGGSVPH